MRSQETTKGYARASTPAASAREAADLTLEQAARQARICPAYLRQVERRGNAPYALARRLSVMYACPMTFFLYPGLGGRTLK